MQQKRLIKLSAQGKVSCHTHDLYVLGGQMLG